MTDVKLLPSSVAAFTEALHGDRGSLDAWLEVHDEREVRAHVEAYARANIGVATAARDAEIEALRAEVGELHMHAKRRDQYAVEKAAQALDWKKRAERLAEALRKLEEREQRDEALLRQALEALGRAHQTAMEQTLKAGIPECAEFAGIAQDLDFVVAALRERLGVKA